MTALAILAIALGGFIGGVLVGSLKHWDAYGTGYAQGFQDGANETVKSLGAGFSELEKSLVKVLKATGVKAKGAA